jgi:glucarate dehydratase
VPTADLLRVEDVAITPVAFRDPPLLNAVGVHEPYAIRAVVEVRTEDGLTGVGETYADAPHLQRLRGAADALVGVDVFDANAMARQVSQSLLQSTPNGDGHGMSGMVTSSRTADRVLSPFEVAAFDLLGQALGRPVSDLLGGAVRDAIPFSGYLFYKWAGHPGQDDDSWGEALDADAIVRQAERMVGDFGFTALKLKGGVLEAVEEVDAIQALHRAFPDLPLRLDPNAAWSVPTALKVASTLEGTLEYLEDPVPSIPGMAQVARQTSLPLATNMCVVAFEQIADAVSQEAVKVILSDHHFWGGLRRSQLLAGLCDTFGLGLSMHSNSHLGISLAAMVHLAAATPNLDYACDTHWPWKDPDEDVITSGQLAFQDGAVAVPTGPGLGVDLDRDALARLHEQYLACGIRERDDAAYMQRIQATRRNELTRD